MTTAQEIHGWGPAFLHLFGVTEEEVRDWPMGKWWLYQQYAQAFLNPNRGTSTEGD